MYLTKQMRNELVAMMRECKAMSEHARTELFPALLKAGRADLVAKHDSKILSLSTATERVFAWALDVEGKPSKKGR